MFLFRSDWSLFWPAAGLNLEPLNPEPLNPEPPSIKSFQCQVKKLSLVAQAVIFEQKIFCLIKNSYVIFLRKLISQFGILQCQP